MVELSTIGSLLEGVCIRIVSLVRAQFAESVTLSSFRASF